MKKSVNQDDKNYEKRRNFNFSLMIISLLLFFFFLFSYFHKWANSLLIKLHFCDHTVCVIYSLIWFAFAIVGGYYLIKKKGISRSWIFIYVIVLIIGIILMNIIPCDSSGKINFGFSSTPSQKGDDNKNSFLDDDFNYSNSTSNSTWISDILNCTDSDGGLIPEVRGRISGLADGELTETGSQDTCHFGMLRELYCEEDNYFSLEVDCKEYFESDFAYCEEGVCKLGEEINCQETCAFYGFSNARGLFMNCSECNSNESCGVFIGSDVVVYEGTPVLCCCGHDTLNSCGDYAVENGYEHWILTEGDCEYTAGVMCGVYGLILDDFSAEFSISVEGENCCVWNCKTTPVTNCTDNDGDHYWVEGGDCGLVDCDDNNPDVNPGAFENCDSLDNNCDGELLENENQYSTGIENCYDGFDNDCDGLIDCGDPNCDWLETCKDCATAKFPDCVGWCKEGDCKLNKEEKKCECIV